MSSAVYTVHLRVRRSLFVVRKNNSVEYKLHCGGWIQLRFIAELPPSVVIFHTGLFNVNLTKLMIVLDCNFVNFTSSIRIWCYLIPVSANRRKLLLLICLSLLPKANALCW